MKKGVPIASILIGSILAVCVLGSIGAAMVGYSSMQTFQDRSRTSEATSNLRSIYLGAASYYAQETWVSVNSPPVTACTVDPASTNNLPRSTRVVLDTSAPSFQEVGFTTGDPSYYRYDIVAEPSRCSHGPNEELYTFVAIGDLDGDGTQSRFTMSARSDVDNSLTRTANVDVRDELE